MVLVCCGPQRAPRYFYRSPCGETAGERLWAWCLLGESLLMKVRVASGSFEALLRR